MNRFIIADASKCIGCRTCEVACVVSQKPYPVYGPCGCRPDKRRAIRYPGSMMAGK